MTPTSETLGTPEAAGDDPRSEHDAAVDGGDTGARRLLATAALLTVPLGIGALALWLAFHSGGYFAGDTAMATVVVAAALAVFVVVAPQPFAGLTWPLGVAVGAMVAFAVLCLVSQAWSGSPIRAVIEFDLALFYALATLLAGLAAHRTSVRTAMPRVMALALVVVAVSGLITRLLPDVWPVAANMEFERLSYPLSYWNAAGLSAVLAAIACLHLASASREPMLVRAPAAAAVPLLATTAFLTFSRGAIVAGAVGVLLYLILARPPGALPALIAIVPTSIAAVAATYRADAVIEQIHATAAGASQGHTVAIVVGACALASGALLAVARPLERRAARWRSPGRRLRRIAGAAIAIAAIGAVIATGLPDQIASRMEGSSHVYNTGDSRQRLTQFGDNGRVDGWRVALRAFADQPLHGTGAGTFALIWVRDRPTDQVVTDAHSLYLEPLAELGVAGGLLILLAVGALVVGTAARIRGPGRAAAAAAFAVLATWALHAGIDWDWEMPAVTLPVLALAASQLAATRPSASVAPRSRRWLLRLATCALLLGLALTPLSMVRSQSSLDEAVAALRSGDCDLAIAAAQRSRNAMSIRPEPYQVMSICALGAGDFKTSLEMMRGALARDPDNWRLRYDLVVIRARAGLDPRPLLRRLQADNPQSWHVRTANRRLRSADPADWRRIGNRLELLL